MTMPPVARQEQHVILAALILLTAASWVLLIWQSAGAEEQMAGVPTGMDAAVFVATWVTMMVAMMFPSASPMILMFARVHRGRRQRGQPFVPTAVFVTPYVGIWTLFGVLAYAAAGAIGASAHGSPWLMDHAARLGAGVVVATGLYQFTPLKDLCLTKCRSPLAFLLNAWRDGYGGTLRMGLEHGAYCVGCCWSLFVLLFLLGMMNVAAMALVAAFIFVEKTLPAGQRIGRITAVLLVAYGALVLAIPGLLPAPWPGRAM